MYNLTKKFSVLRVQFDRKFQFYKYRNFLHVQFDIEIFTSKEIFSFTCTIFSVLH